MRSLRKNYLFGLRHLSRVSPLAIFPGLGSAPWPAVVRAPRPILHSARGLWPGSRLCRVRQCWRDQKPEAHEERHASFEIVTCRSNRSRVRRSSLRSSAASIHPKLSGDKFEESAVSRRSSRSSGIWPICIGCLAFHPENRGNPHIASAHHRLVGFYRSSGRLPVNLSICFLAP
jgi:hypothetical protein